MAGSGGWEWSLGGGEVYRPRPRSRRRKQQALCHPGSQDSDRLQEGKKAWESQTEAARWADSEAGGEARGRDLFLCNISTIENTISDYHYQLNGSPSNCMTVVKKIIYSSLAILSHYNCVGDTAGT